MADQNLGNIVDGQDESLGGGGIGIDNAANKAGLGVRVGPALKAAGFAIVLAGGAAQAQEAPKPKITEVAASENDTDGGFDIEALMAEAEAEAVKSAEILAAQRAETAQERAETEALDRMLEVLTTPSPE